MEYESRLVNLQHVSRELDTRYLGLAHREQALAHSLLELQALHTAVKSLRSQIAEKQLLLAQVTQRLPTLARNEAMDRVKQRLDATPFEQFAQTPRSRKV